MSLIDLVQRKVKAQSYFEHLSGASYIRLLDTPRVWGLPFDNQIMPQAWTRQAEFRRAIEEIVQKSRYRCDLSSLNSPDPDWGKVVLGAMDTALTKRMGRTAPTQFRFLFGQTPLAVLNLNAPPNYVDFKAALVRLIRARSSSWEMMPEIWIGRFYRISDGLIPSLDSLLTPIQAALFGAEAADGDDTRMTWNHSKIIVVDGTEALVGGHNLNMDLFRSYPPVHDLSVVVHGEAAYGSQLFLNKMWECGTDLLVKERLDTSNLSSLSWADLSSDRTKPTDPLTDAAAISYMAAKQQAIVQLHQSGTQTGTDAPPLPQPPPSPTGIREQDLQTLADLQLQVLPERITYNTYDKFSEYKLATRMLSVGKYWNGPSRNTNYLAASEIMKQEVIKAAQRTIRMSQMDLISAWKKNWSDHVVCQWLMDALRTNKRLTVQVVVSPLDAGAGAEGDQYSFGSGAVRTFDLIKYYMTHAVDTDAALDDSDGTRADALSRLQIAPFYYTDLVPVSQTTEGATYQWPGLAQEGYTATLKQRPLSEKPPSQGAIGSAARSLIAASGSVYSKVPSAPGNHAKLTIIDDELYVVGSDNLYPGFLSEFNYLIEGAEAMDDLLGAYWTPLWHYSSPHAISGPVAGTRIQAVKQAIEAVQAESRGVWNYSTANQLPDDWLLATPAVAWGTPYAQFKPAVSGPYPDFGLAVCTPPDDATHLCRPVQATVKTLGERPANLTVGPSDALVDQIYDVITSAETFVDIALRSAPDGRFLAGIRNAITFLSHKPAAQRPAVRVIFSDASKASDLLTTLVRDVDPTTPMPIYVGVVSSTVTAWNHAKIVAVDGKRAIVGGHDLLAAAYLGNDPTFDVSMKVEGKAALAAHDHAELLWQLAQGSSGGSWQWYSLSNVAGRVLDSTAGGYKVQAGLAPPGDLFSSVRAKLATAATWPTAQVPVLTVTRRVNQGSASFFPTAQSYLASLSEPGDVALRALLDTATTTIRISQQALSSRVRLAGAGEISPASSWDLDLFMRLGSALQRNVDVYITISSAGGDTAATINQYMLLVLTRTMGVTDDAAKTLITGHFHVASLRFSATDDTYRNQAPIPNHAKSVIVDEAIFYVGSQDLYPSNLDELGFIVEDRVAALTYLQQYWLPLWAQSQRTASQAYSGAMVSAMEGEAVLFVLELRRNVRLQKTWKDTLAERANLSEAADLTKTALILSDIIRNAGFYTSSTSVLNVLRSPFFTTDRTNHDASDDARRFVNDLMTKSDLLTAFSALIQSQTDSNATATAADAAITSFLSSNNYSCNATQVAAASDDLRNENLVHWIGQYQGWIRTDGGASFTDFTPPDVSSNPRTHARSLLSTTSSDTADSVVDGPTLSVTDNTHAKLGDDDIKGLLFRNRVLSWDTSAGNRSSGSLTFSQITQPGFSDPFTGWEVFGTITFPEDGTAPSRGKVSYFARWNKAVNLANPDSPTPFPWPVYIILGLVGLLGLLALGYASWRRAQAQEQIARDAILKDIGAYQPINERDATEFEQLSEDLRTGRITSSQFKNRIAEMNRRVRNARAEVLEMQDLSERALGRIDYRLSPMEARAQLYQRLQQSLKEMVDREAELLDKTLELSSGSPEYDQLAQSASQLSDQVDALTVGTRTDKLNELFDGLTKQTTRLNQYVEKTAKAQAQGNQDWLDASRQLDSDRVRAAERANDVRARIDGLDKYESPEDTRIPEDDLDLPAEAI